MKYYIFSLKSQTIYYIDNDFILKIGRLSCVSSSTVTHESKSFDFEVNDFDNVIIIQNNADMSNQETV